MIGRERRQPSLPALARFGDEHRGAFAAEIGRKPRKPAAAASVGVNMRIG